MLVNLFVSGLHFCFVSREFFFSFFFSSFGEGGGGGGAGWIKRRIRRKKSLGEVGVRVGGNLQGDNGKCCESFI